MSDHPAPSGVLIAIEGIDGAGKSTLQQHLARRLRSKGWSVRMEREPHDPVLGAEALQHSRSDPWRAAAYFTYDRLAANGALRRQLKERGIVLLDRSFFSTLAYQGAHLTATGVEWLEHLQRAVTSAPERVLFLRLGAETAIARVRKRGRRASPVERLRELRSVEHAYEALAGRPEWILLDAEQPVTALAREAERRLAPWLNERLPIRRTRRKKAE